MKIIHIASEAAPIAKAGGLGDVIFGLSKECLRQGHTVEILIPKYDCLNYTLLKDLKPEYLDLWSFDGPYQIHNTVWSASYEGVKILLLEPHHPSFFFSRGKIYGCDDDIDRFAYFSRACMEYLYKSGSDHDVIHLHDWPTALGAVLYKEMYLPLGMKERKVILTIHNLEYQGKCAPHQLTRIGLRGDDLLTAEKLQDPLQPELLNLLKGGILYSHAITTVSPTYEKEIKTKEGGCHLEGILKACEKKLKGILNGIDLDYWNPQMDPFLSQPYGTDGQGKEKNKRALQKELGLKANGAPLVCAITRLVKQKGPDLIAHALECALEQEAQFVLLGSPAEAGVEALFKILQKKYAKNKNLVIYLNYNERLAHLLYAASDIIVIPSIFEPCGLTQMIALRYGTIPVVRKTGGLADTVTDGKNGFSFLTPDNRSVQSALSKAIETYRDQQTTWSSLMQQAFENNFSWTKSAQEYLKVYKSLHPSGSALINAKPPSR